MTLVERSQEEKDPLIDEDRWQYRYVRNFTRGMNTSLSGQAIRDDELTLGENVIEDKGDLKKDTGYIDFANVVLGTPRAAYQFFKKDGTSELVLVTNVTFYKYSVGNNEWEFIQDGTVSEVLSGSESLGATVLEVASTTGFGNGDKIGIRLDDGTEYHTTISSFIADTSITIPSGLPSAAASGKLIVKAVDLTGSDNIPPSFVTWANTDSMYFANGVNHPKKYNGSTCIDIPGLTGISNFFCRIVVLFNDYLLLLNTSEAGTVFPQRTRWANTGSDSAWNTGVNFNDLLTTEDHITAASQLGPYLIIYKERAIVRVEFLGDPDQTFNFESVIQGEGTINQDTIINLDDKHIVFGNANTYEYEAGFDLDPIGDNIWDILYANDGEVEPTKSERAFSIYVEERDEAWVFYVKTGDSYPQSMLRYRGTTGSWLKRSWPNEITGFGFYQKDSSKTWNDLSGDWFAQDFSWVSATLQANAPTMLLCGRDELRVYEYDYSASDDSGTAIAYEVQTKDFFQPNRDLRFDRHEFFMIGASITIEASVNEGDTWISIGVATPGTKMKRVRFYNQFIGDTIRYRFSGNSGFSIRWLGFNWKYESVNSDLIA